MLDLSSTRKRVELQGFRNLTDEEIAGINYGLRVAPAICMLWGAIGTGLASPLILLSLAPFALMGAVFPSHPFDIVYRSWLQERIHGKPLPPYPFPRRMACVSATFMITAASAAMLLGRPGIGLAFGATMTAAAGLNVLTGICVPPLLMRLLATMRANLASARR